MFSSGLAKDLGRIYMQILFYIHFSDSPVSEIRPLTSSLLAALAAPNSIL